MQKNEYQFTKYDVNQIIEIFSSQQSHNSYKCVFIPAYLRIKVKGINELNVGLLNGNIKLLMILVIYYGNKQYLLNHLKNNIKLTINQSIVLDLSKVDSEQVMKRGSRSHKQTIQKIILNNNNLPNPQSIILRHDTIQKTLNYLINIEIKVKIQPKVAFTPLEYINTKFKVAINNFYFRQIIQSIQSPKPQFCLKPQKISSFDEQLIQSQQMVDDSQQQSKEQLHNPNPEQYKKNLFLDSIRSKYSNKFHFKVHRKQSLMKSTKQFYQVVNVKFNFMTTNQKYLKIYFEDGITLGDYDLAEKNLQMMFNSNIKDRNSFCFYYDLQTNRHIQQKKKALEAITSFWKRNNKKQPIQLFNFNIHVLNILRKTLSFNQCAQKLTNNNYQQEAERILKDKKLIQKAFLSETQIQNIHKNYQQMGKQQLIVSLIQSLQTFNVATIYVPFYRQPIAMIISLLIPFLMLGLINLGVFFQSNDISSRVACIATILVAFNAFLPAFRQQLPSVPKVTLVQILIILQVLTCLLCGIQSISVGKIKNYKFDWQKDYYYLLSLFITLSNLLVITIMAILHFCYFRLKYNDFEDNRHSKPFIRHKWFNQNFSKTLNQLKIIKGHITIQSEEQKNINENSTASFTKNSSLSLKKKKKKTRAKNILFLISTIKIVGFTLFLVFCIFCYIRIFAPKSFIKKSKY